MTTASFKVMRYLIGGLLLATIIAILFGSCVKKESSKPAIQKMTKEISTCRHWLPAHCESGARL